MSGTIEAKVTHRYAVGPERVYDAFVDPRLVRLWQEAWLRHLNLSGELSRFEFDPVVGGKFVFADVRPEGEAVNSGTFLALDRPSKVSFTWVTDEEDDEEPPVVTVIIEPEPDGPGSIATLYNEMDAQWAEWVPQTEYAWRGMLQAIDAVLSTEGPWRGL